MRSPNEKTIVHEEHFSYGKFIWTLLNEAHHRKLPVKVIGSEKMKRTGITYPLYRLIIHPDVRQTICLVAGIHGNEIAGPLSILHMITDSLRDLPRQYRIVMYPMINPSGYDLRQRYNADGRDLNAIYSVTLKSRNYSGVQAFYQDVLKFAPFEAVITLHEDSGLDKFYMYGLGRENLDFYHALCAFAKTLIPPWANAEFEGCCTDEHGLVLATARDHAFDGTLYNQGLTRVACTFETPGKLHIQFRVNMMVQLVLKSMIMLDGNN